MQLIDAALALSCAVPASSAYWYDVATLPALSVLCWCAQGGGDAIARLGTIEDTGLVRAASNGTLTHTREKRWQEGQATAANALI